MADNYPSLSAFFEKRNALFTSLQNLFLITIRLHGGFLFFYGGLQWIAAPPIAKFYFESLRIHWPGLYLMLFGIGGILGGFFLFFGIFTRTSALFFTILSSTLLNRTYFALNVGFDWFINPSLLFSQSSFPFFFISLLIFLFGPGTLSIDSYWQKNRKTKTFKKS